jgi:hypothetical protein
MSGALGAAHAGFVRRLAVTDSGAPPGVTCAAMARPPDRHELRIPLGGLSRHAVRRPRLHRVMLSWPLVVALAGAAAAVAGVALVTAEPEVDVSLDAGGYHIDGQRLVAQGDGVFLGPGGAALVIASRPDGRVAGASAVLDGHRTTGHCEPAPEGESCRFTMDGQALTAEDTRTADGWHRRYGDGRTVTIRLSGDTDTPVPFPIGR